jgi:hypothetical protein
LAGVHTELPEAPHLDGVYLDRATFEARPAEHQTVPFVVDGELRTGVPAASSIPYCG